MSVKAITAQVAWHVERSERRRSVCQKCNLRVHSSVATVGLGQEAGECPGGCLRERAKLTQTFGAKYGSVHELGSPATCSGLMRYWQPNFFTTPFPPPFAFSSKASTAIAGVLDLRGQYQCVNRAIWGRDLVNGNIRLGRPIFSQ
jgi:hypothetical protein